MRSVSSSAVRSPITSAVIDPVAAGTATAITRTGAVPIVVSRTTVCPVASAARVSASSVIGSSGDPPEMIVSPTTPVRPARCRRVRVPAS